jgi:hypothetical protein
VPLAPPLPHAARVQDRAGSALHEELAVGIRVVLIRALSAGARSEEQRDDARIGEFLDVGGAVYEKVFGPVVLVTFGAAAVVGDVLVVGVAERNLPEDPALLGLLVPQAKPLRVAVEALR